MLATAELRGYIPRMSRFENIGQALRLLRERQKINQKDLAQAAGITSAMLSNYETGTKKPSLDSLGKLLDALGIYLGKLDDSLDVVNERPMRRDRLGLGDPLSALPDVTARPYDLRAFVGAEVELPPDLEKGFVEMIEGFRLITRYLYRQVRDVSRRGL